MKIAGFQKLTLLDYPQEIACIIFTQGCNFACPFCHNSALIKIESDQDTVSEEEVFDYLEKRKKILSGVVITGGEPTVQKDLKEFIIKVKALGYKVKLDTNGYNPFALKDLLDNDLLDYVAMDIKNSLEKYAKTCGLNKMHLNKILQSIELLKKSKIPYEFRTTVIKEYHEVEDIEKIIELIGKDCPYYLQNFKDNEAVIEKNLHGFSEKELKDLERLLKPKNEKIEVR